MEWADALIWTTLDDVPDAPRDERLRELLHHVHAVQWAYLMIWRHEAVHVPELEDFEGLDGVRSWGREYHRQLPLLLSSLEASELDRPLELPWADQLAEAYGEVHPVLLRQSILQVACHSTYHRGQINTRIRELGGEPPLTDFVAWLWAGRPGPSWPGGRGPEPEL